MSYQSIEEAKASIERSKRDAHEETMWGKPARDIITGIGNNRGITPVRAIWELVQNARDVVVEGNYVEIIFTRRKNEFIFQHDGIPFTNKTIEALILQTSSKVSNNSVQVGQYGTGFLTTHLFGLSFRLSAPLRVSDDFLIFYNISDFEIDRSATEKENMRDKLKEQWKETQKWGENFEDITSHPQKHTIFKYIHKYDIERDNVRIAFDKAPAMVPYVLTLNTNVGTIAFVDDVKFDIVRFEKTDKTFEYVEALTTGIIYKTIIKKVIVNKEGREESKDFFVYTMNSNEQTMDEPRRSKVVVILPLTEVDGKLKVVHFEDDLPQLYIYLPLLGSEQWGLNFMLHSSSFTCDKDSRDSLRLIGNGQNNDSQAESNKALIALGASMIWEFIQKKHNSLLDAKYLVHANFKIHQSDEQLATYYKQQQKDWREKFETLCLIQNGATYVVKTVRVLDVALCKACEEDSSLLDALYSFFVKCSDLIVPQKEDMIYWSKTLQNWYDGDTNKHALTLEDIARLIDGSTIEVTDVKWLHTICKYIVESKLDTFFDQYALIPNETLKLQKKTLMLHPMSFPVVVKQALKVMVPDTIDVFTHAQFFDIGGLKAYVETNAKEDISNFINKHNEEQNKYRTQVLNAKAYDRYAVSSNTKQFKEGTYKEYLYSTEAVVAILNLYQAIVGDDQQAFTTKTLNSLLQYYDIMRDYTIERIKDGYIEVRQCYTTLIYDALFGFTIQENKQSKSEWCKGFVRQLYDYSETREMLSKYEVYPDQIGTFKYAEWLTKQPTDTPDRALEIYDVVVRGVTPKDNKQSIKHELVSKEYTDVFVGNSVFASLEHCKELEEIIEKKGYSITNYEHEKLIVEIIEKMTISGQEGRRWSHLFTDIDNHKGQIMFSVIQSQTKRDSIFQIMKLEDDAKLKLIADLSTMDNLAEIVELGRKEAKRLHDEQKDKQYKHKLGEYVEMYLFKELQDELKGINLKVDVEDEQGGQDIIIKDGDTPLYYIEVKSRWTSDRSVLMSALQHQRSESNPDKYALFSVNMYEFDRRYVDEHIYPPFEETKDRIKVVNNIGELNKGLLKKVADYTTEAHVNSDYKITVPQRLIDKEMISFDEFMQVVIVRLQKYMNSKVYNGHFVS